jgi:hypothetical protein
MAATRCGGLVDSVIDGRTGVLVAPSDPGDLARGILSLLDDREAARAFGRNGRQLMLEKFTLRKTVEDLDALYRSLAATAGGRYRLPRGIWRAAVGSFVCAYLAGRYWLLDLRLLPALDAGWRPWHLSRWRLLAARLKYAVMRRIMPARAAALTEAAAAPTPLNEQFRSSAAPQPSPPGRIMTAARMRLYRFYAFVGRRKLGWGLRRRAKDTLKRALRL